MIKSRPDEGCWIALLRPSVLCVLVVVVAASSLQKGAVRTKRIGTRRTHNDDVDGDDDYDKVVCSRQFGLNNNVGGTKREGL